MADKKKMSVADILAAARKADGQDGAASESEATPPAPEETAAAEPAAAENESSAGPPPKIAKPGSPDRPSVAEMMKMARGEKSGAAKKPAAKAAPKKAAAAAKPAAAKKAESKGPVARDTASILAAARKASKPGPMSKAEAAAKEKSDPKAKPAKPKIVVPPMPEKPAYAKPAATKKAAGKKKEPAEQDRRGFLNLGFWMVGLVSLLWSLLSLKFLFPNVRREPPSKFKVGFPDAFAAGQVQTKYKAQYGVWIANADYNGEQVIYALKSVCTHLGCTPNWLEAEQKFKCPCHGSGFYKDGINFEGPAPRPLERYAIRIADDGQIEIDKSKTFQEEMGQWSDPSCYISV